MYKPQHNDYYVSSKSIYPLPCRKFMADHVQGNIHTISGFTKILAYCIGLLSRLEKHIEFGYWTHAVCD